MRTHQLDRASRSRRHTIDAESPIVEPPLKTNPNVNAKLPFQSPGELRNLNINFRIHKKKNTNSLFFSQFIKNEKKRKYHFNHLLFFLMHFPRTITFPILE